MSRLDISFSIGVRPWFETNPKVSHLNTIKCINGTCKYGTWYSSDFNTSIVGFFNADWERNVDDKKTQGRYSTLEVIWWHDKTRSKI